MKKAGMIMTIVGIVIMVLSVLVGVGGGIGCTVCGTGLDIITAFLTLGLGTVTGWTIGTISMVCGGIGGPVGLILTIVGVILWIVGASQEKSQPSTDTESASATNSSNVRRMQALFTRHA